MASMEGGGGHDDAKITHGAWRRGSGRPPPPEEETGLGCPRCGSPNTKFCYYNNYNIKQPRYYCKACRRCWTRGGALRGMSIRSGFRKNKKFKSSSSSSSTTTAAAAAASMPSMLPFDIKEPLSYNTESADHLFKFFHGFSPVPHLSGISNRSAISMDGAGASVTSSPMIATDNYNHPIGTFSESNMDNTTPVGSSMHSLRYTNQDLLHWEIQQHHKEGGGSNNSTRVSDLPAASSSTMQYQKQAISMLGIPRTNGGSLSNGSTEDEQLIDYY